MGGFCKKAEAGLMTILVIVIVIFLFGLLVNFGRECKRNSDCGSESYCGSDFQCHQYPNIQKTVIQYSLFWPAVIIGIAVVFAAWILKSREDDPEPENQKTEPIVEAEEVEDISEPYYKSDSNVKHP